ncbi:MAG: NERD domain-containing protein, partial [Gammaproteobacteria bacterium]|nr:NERD domain-containing protein [Gammaproteobacteria bacterium]
MSELFQRINDFMMNNPVFVTWIVAVLIFALGVVLQRLWIKEYISEWKLNDLLKKTGKESLHNVIIPDGLDGKIFIEYLILMPKKILLLGVKKYRGLIFAADEIDLWTQVIGKKSYKFSNPLRQLENDAIALNSKIENSKIEVKVLFINGSDFPKGKPDNVVSMMDAKELSKSYAAGDVPEALDADWKQLLELAV